MGVVARFSVVTDGGHHKLEMNSSADPTVGIVGICVRSCPSIVDRPLPARGCIGLTRLVSPPSNRIGPLSVISDA